MLKVGVGDQQWTQIKVGDRAKISTDAMPTDLSCKKYNRDERKQCSFQSECRNGRKEVGI
jgi:hypothetical protein